MAKQIDVLLKNGVEKKIQVESGILVTELLKKIDKNNFFIAAKVNNEVTSLSYVINVNSTVEFLSNNCDAGMDVYRRSLCFVLEMAVNKLFPDRRLVIGHSLGPGYFFDLDGDILNEETVAVIEEEMRKIINADKIIFREKISYTDALDHFKKTGRTDKFKLLSAQNMSKLSIYRCDDFFEVFDLPLASHTGVLNVFSLIFYPPGLMLQFPKIDTPQQVSPFAEQRKIFEVYREYKEWGRILKVDNVGALNEIIINNEVGGFIQVTEALQTKKIINIANNIFINKDRIRLISIAGPSSSGKTTFSKRLAIQLRALGLHPVTISVDNYFVDREKTPLDEKGNPDYETIDAINLELFNEHLKKLLNGKGVQLATYSFLTGKSSFSNEELKIKRDEIIIIEGIHCLNDKLTYNVNKDNKFKVYISVLNQMNIDDNNRIPTTDNRIIRRMVRDYKYRGHSALRTLQMWPSVRRGEEKYIFPFQNEADGYFNSALDYELALLKPYAEPILRQIKPYHPEYAEAVRLLKFLSYFLVIHQKDVPPTSIIREFIGGSFFDY